MSTKNNSIIDFPDDYTVIDIETTGFSPRFDAIIEIAAIRYRNNVDVDSYSTLINPGIPIAPEITRITGIRDSDVADKPAIGDVINEYLNFIGNDIIVGHNVGFDINFLNANSKIPIENKYVNTMRLSHKVNPDLESHSLWMIKELYEISSNLHRALSDCESTALVLQEMKKKVLCQMSLDEFKSLYKKKKHNFKSGDITTSNTEFDENNLFFGKQCVFTGKLEKYTRKEALQVIVDLGGIASNSITTKTNVLVVGDMEYSASIKGNITAKHKKAMDLRQKGQDIIIISESDFINFINL